jgi:isopentenyl-diphosphate delta-isomerase
MERELELVELVSTAGVAIGTATVAEAHAAPGALHRAFSVLLFDPHGRTLLQQRARVKTRFPLRWANTCCGHPSPGEPVSAAATRRLAEELGVVGVELTEVGTYTYQASDPATGRVEHEYDHVLLGHVPGDLPTSVDEAEVADLRWALPQDLHAEERHHYAPWFAGVLAVAMPGLTSSGLS